MIEINNKLSIFGTDGIRGKVGSEKVHPQFILKLGWALGRVLIEQGLSGHVIIGKDTRISGYMLESSLEAGLSSAGVDIHLLGPMPTPAISYLTKTFRASAGIVISASHNLFCDNGIKFFNNNGIKLSSDFESLIEQQMSEPMEIVHSNKMGKAYRVIDAPGRYIEFCKGTISSDITLNGFKIVLDCANGANYHIAPSVFTELGALVKTINNEPDGCNINQGCGSTDPSQLQQYVHETKADLGIAFDGDGDRLIMIDCNGKIIDGDDILLITAKYLNSIGRLRGGVVGTLMTNMGIEKSLQSMGIEFVRSKVGDKYIIEQLNKRGWSLGGEESGHIINFKFNQTGDGIVAALQVLAAMVHFNKSLSELRAEIIKYPKVLKNIPTNEATQILHKPELQKKINKITSTMGNNGRILIRPSGTEPLIRVMVEGLDQTLVEKTANNLYSCIQEYT